MSEFKRGQSVWVHHDDGREDENYVGGGIFVRHVTKADTGYAYTLDIEPHCVVKISPTDSGSCFPTRCVKASRTKKSLAKKKSRPKKKGMTTLIAQDIKVGGCVIHLEFEPKGGGSISSNLRAGVEPDETDTLAMIDAIESVVLAHACAGVDVDSPEYREGLTTSLEKILL